MLSAVIVAAGSSTRAGFDKLLAEIAGKPVLWHSVAAFAHSDCVSEIILVGREPDRLRGLLGTEGNDKLTAIIQGGARRQDSVAAGLAAISSAAEFVAVHDAARPLITPGEIERVFAVARREKAAVLAAPVTDTLKVADEKLHVTSSVDRQQIFAMQTPQIFERKLLQEAFARVRRESLTITDEVSAVQNLGAEVTIVPAEEQNMKITYAGDLALAEFILQQRANRN